MNEKCKKTIACIFGAIGTFILSVLCGKSLYDKRNATREVEKRNSDARKLNNTTRTRIERMQSRNDEIKQHLDRASGIIEEIEKQRIEN